MFCGEREDNAAAMLEWITVHGNQGMQKMLIVSQWKVIMM